MSEDQHTTEEFHLKGDDVVAKIKELVREGNVRRVIVANAEGKVLVEIPVTIGVVGVLLVPTLAAIGALAAVLTDCTIKVVRDGTPPSDA
ncbi:MAG TPA: DUF4342 domain-containing protein [Acidimicrobiia bacterium]|jgi:hypothetical protein